MNANPLLDAKNFLLSLRDFLVLAVPSPIWNVALFALTISLAWFIIRQFKE